MHWNMGILPVTTSSERMFSIHPQKQLSTASSTSVRGGKLTQPIYTIISSSSMWFRSCAGTGCCELVSLIAMSVQKTAPTSLRSVPCAHTVSTSSSRTFRALVVVRGGIHLFIYFYQFIKYQISLQLFKKYIVGFGLTSPSPSCPSTPCTLPTSTFLPPLLPPSYHSVLLPSPT